MVWLGVSAFFFLAGKSTFGSTTPRTSTRSQIKTEALIQVTRPPIRKPLVNMAVKSKEKKVVASAIRLLKLGAYFLVSFQTKGAKTI